MSDTPHAGGRPTIYNKEKAAKFIEHISEFVPYKIACYAAGFGYRTLYNWIDKGLEDIENEIDSELGQFVYSIKNAQTKQIKNRIGIVGENGPGWQGSAWILERCHGKHFGRDADLIEGVEKKIGEIEVVLNRIVEGKK